MTSQERALLKKYAEVQHKAEMFDIIRKQKLIRIRRNLSKHGAKMSTTSLKLHTGNQILKPLKVIMKSLDKQQKSIEKQKKRLHKEMKRELKEEFKGYKNYKNLTEKRAQIFAKARAEMLKAEAAMDEEMKRLEKVESASRKMYTEAEAIAEAVEQRLTGEFNGTPHMADKARHLYNATIAKFNEDPEMRMLYLLRWKEILGLRSLMRLIDQYFYGSDPWQTYRVGDDLYSNPAFQGDIQNVDAWDEILGAAFEPLEDWKMNDINEAFMTYLEDDMY
jgi:hypothetical protein